MRKGWGAPGFELDHFLCVPVTQTCLLAGDTSISPAKVGLEFVLDHFVLKTPIHLWMVNLTFYQSAHSCG